MKLFNKLKLDKRYIIIAAAALLGAALIGLAIFVFANAFSPDAEWSESMAGGESGVVLSLYPEMSAESEAEHYGSASNAAPGNEPSSKDAKPAPSAAPASSTSPGYAPHKQPPLDTPLDDITVTLYKNGAASEITKNKLNRVKTALKKMFSEMNYMPPQTPDVGGAAAADYAKKHDTCIEITYNDRGDMLLIPATGKYKYYIFMYKNGEYQNVGGYAQDNNTIINVINAL